MPNGLKFIASGLCFSTYTDRDGKPVYIGNGGLRRLALPQELPALWVEFQEANRYADGEDWLDAIRESLESFTADFDTAWCNDCEVLLVEDWPSVGDNGCDPVCDSCFTMYSSCDYCSEHYRTETMTADLNDDLVCDYCRRHSYSYCEYCDGYDRDSVEHDHDDDDEDACGCESPMRTFSVPHDGAHLGNDDEITLSLPAGTITDEGLAAISRLIYAASSDQPYAERVALGQVSNLAYKVGSEWQTRKGNYTKRLSKLAYQQHGYKISTDLLGKIGSMAREHSSETKELTIAVTRNLNQSAEDFGHDDSCWWQSYYASRCAFKSNGGFGLRSFSNNRWGSRETSGRTWVIPLKLTMRPGTIDGTPRLMPTFDAATPDAFIVFNGYGDLSGYTGARVMAQLSGMTYRKITFTGDPMYVNGNSGYLVSTEPYLQDELRLNLVTHATLFTTETAAKETANVA